MIDPVFQLTIDLALALLFFAAAWHKLTDRARFAATVRAYGLLPSPAALGLAGFLPLAELFIAVGLLVPALNPAAAIAAMAILTLYTLAIAASLARGRRDIDCGCFASTARVPLSPWLIARNLALLGASAALLLPVRERGLIWVDWLTLAMALLTLALLWTATQRLLQTGPVLRRMRGTG